MESNKKLINSNALIGIGIAAGVVIAFVDNLAFGGEVSPIVIVLMLVIVTAVSGFIWGWRGWLVTYSTWLCIPFVHLIKHIFGLPDTLHPNTYSSIMMLGAFTLVVSTMGLGSGVLFRKVISN